MAQQYDVVIIGAGIAGLCAALQLQNEGLNVKIYDAADAAGGRVRTDKQDGFLLDRGFQVLLTAYPEATRLLDFDQLGLKHFAPGTMIYYHDKFHRLIDPFRNPMGVFSTLLNPIANWADRIKIVALRNRHKRLSIPQLFEQPEQSSLSFLHEWQFSDTMIEAFFKPFLGGIFLDTELQTSSRMLEFVLKMFSEGYAALPAEGIQAIPRQIESQLLKDTIQLNTRVTKVEKNKITLENGEKINARAILIATDAPQAQQLLGNTATINTQANSVRCIYFAADKPPLAAPILLLNGSGKGIINNVAIPSLVNPQYAPAGRHLISVSVIQPTNHLTDEQLFIQVRSELRHWFKKEVRYWEYLKTYTIPYALPQSPNLQPLHKDNIQPIQPGIYICGDHLNTPSLNGAMESARLTADTISWDLALNKN
jgi:protoporphyrinogen oxidase